MNDSPPQWESPWSAQLLNRNPIEEALLSTSPIQAPTWMITFIRRWNYGHDEIHEYVKSMDIHECHEIQEKMKPISMMESLKYMNTDGIHDQSWTPWQWWKSWNSLAYAMVDIHKTWKKSWKYCMNSVNIMKLCHRPLRKSVTIWRNVVFGSRVAALPR